MRAGCEGEGTEWEGPGLGRKGGSRLGRGKEEGGRVGRR